jgi:hypothetical protein
MSASFTEVRYFGKQASGKQTSPEGDLAGPGLLCSRPSGPPTSSTRCGFLTLALLAAAFVSQLLGALLPDAHQLIAGSAAGLTLELYALRRQPRLLSLLGKVRFDVPTRQLLRDMLMVIGLAGLPGIDPSAQTLLVLALLSAYGTHFACQAVAVLVRRNRTLPIITRNIDTAALRLSAAPPRLLSRQPSRRLLYFMIPGTAGLLVAAGTKDTNWALVGVSASVVGLLAGTVHLATWLLPGKRTAGEQHALDWLGTWLAEYRPTVGLYFSGGTMSAYQANMWLSTLARLGGKPVILLRERFMVQKIDATDIPIVCIPKVTHLMRLEHSTLTTLLHPANSGKTSQVLRIPSIKHAFINHGESDKQSSCNPYAKAYDEVWVAGPAARERYRLADIGVEDKDVVEVGRPQLAPIRPYAGAPADGSFTTVLYAPTWEGWTDDPGNTSLILAGENIVRELLADPQVRLLYKPHPMTGSVDPRAGHADATIQAMISEANARRGGARPGPEAAAELQRRTAELDRLTRTDFRPGADETERMMLQSAPAVGRAAAVAAATTAWEAACWAAFPDWEHQIITAARPAICTCFNQADLLISDVSSVVSDYLTSEKPYAVVNTSGWGEDDFRTCFPTVRAATVLTAQADGVPALLASVRSPKHDTLAKARASLKEYLLGRSDPPPLVRFNRAVLALSAKADERRARVATGPAARIPAQLETAGAAGEMAREA